MSDQQRLAGAAMLRTLHDLRRSIEAGRPMTLPNCVRLCKGRLAKLNLPRKSPSQRLAGLISRYRIRQPFRSTGYAHPDPHTPGVHVP